MKINVTVELDFDEHSIPVIEFSEGDVFKVTVEPNNEIFIEGDKAGLTALAKIILSTANTPGYHNHFEEELHSKFFNSNGSSLTISNSEPIKKSERTTNIPPPQW
ncbi:hypothetical protein ONV78_24375 [Hahella sp. CR1]|uniref:Imm32 family immunity protein n=1 Tax=Hahella sp. CR1 TaxID=2992807 RepID=UPI0024436CEF|nr:hypothetical protein [Hahella sp. CR1]MDG9670898.1 hypothetical protein [Hahella sp. CR1]